MNFTKLQFDILQGCLLGDGALVLPKEGKNAYFVYLSASRQHVEFVHNFFKNLCTDKYKDKPLRNEIYDNRTNKTYTNYQFRTKALPLFTTQYYRWYKDKKIVPSNLEVNGDVLLFWYIGDGQLVKQSGEIRLHSNSFTESEVSILCKKMGFSSHTLKKGKNTSQWMIRIPRSSVSQFLKVIGDCPFKDYAHKWEQVPYKNKNIEKNGFRNHEGKYPSIIKDWEKGKYSIYQLSKKYDIDINSIKHHFSTHRVEISPKKMTKEILQFSLEGKEVCEWDSGQKIKKVLGYNASAISECCRGIRKTYKGFIWKFKNR